LNKGIYELVYSGKYWNIEFSKLLSPKDSSNPKLNYPILSLQPTQPMVMPSFSTTCYMLAAMIPSKMNAKTLSAIALTLNF
jgi:hypothetical protein